MASRIRRLRKVGAPVAETGGASPLMAALASKNLRVEGAGGLRGRLRDFSFDLETGEILYALVGVGGWFGVGERLVVLAWSLLKFDVAERRFTAPVTRQDLRRARRLTVSDLRSLGVRCSPQWRFAGVPLSDATSAAY